ncbi:MAG: nucleotidyltransferase [Clostridiales bacterium]|jgi:predicted nucleotidyltransferase|nr:nucleotidyltransferase [Clostridiales bacterium]
MNVIGIVAEYNPFHKGHLYHLEETKKRGQADCIVAVMSGNFTQRGEPAMINKWKRAEIAIKNGVDLVIELPFAFACNNAEYFARGAIKIFEGLGCISKFSFGSEKGNLEELIKTARVLAFEDNDFKLLIKKYSNKGLSYPKARYEALCEYRGSEVASAVMHPNNILGVEYLKEWLRLNSKMEPMAVKRKGSGYHDLELHDEISSASAIRQSIDKNRGLNQIKHTVPLSTIKVLEDFDFNSFLTLNDLFELFVYKILSTDRDELESILSATEGLENRLKKSIIKSKNTDDLIRKIKTKRYTSTRVQRLLIHTLIGLKKEDFFDILNSKILYARILGLSKKGSDLLALINKQGCSTIPILNKITKEIEKDEIWKLIKYDILSSDIYNLLSLKDTYTYSDLVQKPFIYF